MNQNLLNEIFRVVPGVVATGMMQSLCTIQQPDGGLDPAGAPDQGFTDVAGLVNILCMDAVPSASRIVATEVKELAEIAAKGLRHVMLNGYYPTIIGGVANGWRAIVSDNDAGSPVNPITYDILGAEPDSQRTQTRLSLQLLNV